LLKEVIEFHETFNHPINVEPSFNLLKLRYDLIAEEVKEAADEFATMALQVENDATPEAITKTKAKLTKELSDILYVVYGAAVSLGLPLEEGFKEVHRSNMSKLGEDGKPIFREDGKVLKGPNYTEPDMEKLFK
jgi:predicted HAD superfamily Cof-like phosphohydrolase